MLEQAFAVGSADWWLLRLGKGLSGDLPMLTELQKYDVGNHPLPVGNQNMREIYHRFSKMARSNYCGLISSTVVERLNVTGFFTGADNYAATDTAAWKIWQANSLDAESVFVHHQAVSLGRAYVLVGPPDPTDLESPTAPVITVESPFQVYHEADPKRPRRVAAAIKTYFDAIRNRQVAIVYLPQSITYFIAVNQGQPQLVDWRETSWEIDDSEYENGSIANPLGVVPIVPFVNRADLNPMGFSEFGDVTDIQDRINVTVLSRLVIQYMQSYRQRYVIGVEVEDPNGNPRRLFDPGSDLLWAIPDDGEGNQGVKFGDFEVTDMSGILSAIEADVAILGNLSRTPPHYLTGQLVNVSGDALTVAESALVSKIKNRQISFGEAWERVIRLAGLYTGVPVGQDSVITWADAERRSVSALADAATKWQAAGVPFRERMTLLGFTPSEIDRIEAERIKDAFVEGLNSPIGVAPGTPGATINQQDDNPGDIAAGSQVATPSGHGE